MKIGERTINNALFSAVSGLLPLALSFIFWPYIVGNLGESAYGIFALVGSVIGYLTLLDLGLGNAVVKYVAEYAGQRDQEKVKELIGVALSLFATVGIVGFLIILLIANVLATHLLKIPPELVNEAYRCFSAASLGFFFTMSMTLLSAIINGLNRYDISSVTTAVTGAISTLGAVALLRGGFGLVALVWLNVIIPAGVSLFYFFSIQRLLPNIPVRFSFDIATFKRVLSFGMYSILGRVAGVITNQVGPILIGTFLGVASVTYYIIPFTILNRLTSLLGRIGMVILPAISELQGQRRLAVIRQFYLTSYRIIFSFAIAFIVPLLIFGVRFLSLWMGPEFAEQGGSVLFILSIGIFFDLCTNVPCFVVNGLGRPKISSIAALSSSVIFLCLLIPGADTGGIIGVAAAFAISQLFVAPFFIRYVNCTVVGATMAELWKEVYQRPLLTGLVVAVPLLFVPQKQIQNIFYLLLVMGAGMGSYFILALASGVYQPQERRILMEYLRRVTRRIRGRRGS